ncbi:hypothetical protein BC939DRAFT_480670 [Gamsiella multidivaricata]|uniref:uncharacterized protein n=1 Tax=Gamsiella multidivaricata TaxID=101098 RepID=UPI00221F66CF|nr:uncharacterized protein BC939DRAFT_480670 [Gamsiella multidivaricata]KAI7818114.1 hypothetical protein BC939DRAFT_480670 [Gamsiella multidivaricata]
MAVFIVYNRVELKTPELGPEPGPYQHLTLYAAEAAVYAPLPETGLLFGENRVTIFVPSGSSAGSGSSGYPGSRDRTSNDRDSNSLKTKSIGLILATATVNSILALVVIGGAILVICKRNRRHRNLNTNQRNST